MYLPQIFIFQLAVGYRWDLFDVEKNELRKHDGKYFIAKFQNHHSDIASKKAVYGTQNISNGL